MDPPTAGVPARCCAGDGRSDRPGLQPWGSHPNATGSGWENWPSTSLVLGAQWILDVIHRGHRRCGHCGEVGITQVNGDAAGVETRVDDGVDDDCRLCVVIRHPQPVHRGPVVSPRDGNDNPLPLGGRPQGARIWPARRPHRGHWGKGGLPLQGGGVDAVWVANLAGAADGGSTVLSTTCGSVDNGSIMQTDAPGFPAERDSVTIRLREDGRGVTEDVERGLVHPHSVDQPVENFRFTRPGVVLRDVRHGRGSPRGE